MGPLRLISSRCLFATWRGFLALSLALGAWLLPQPLLADVLVTAERIWTTDSGGVEKSQFLPGEGIRYRARLRVLNGSSGLLSVRLRILGDGWYETLEKTALPVPGVQEIIWGDDVFLRTSADACEGKIALHLDVQWKDPAQQEPIELLGRRHGYLSLSCEPGGFPRRLLARIPVGEGPFDMALTGDGRFLYVTSKEGGSISVIRAEEPFDLVAEISDPERIGEPTGMALAANGTDMLVADFTLQKIHILDTTTHELRATIPVEVESGRLSLGDLVMHPLRNEFYVADVRSTRILAFDGQTFAFQEHPLRFRDLQPTKLLVDRLGFFLYALCGTGVLVKVDLSPQRMGEVVDSAEGLPIETFSMLFDLGYQNIYVVKAGDRQRGVPGTFSSVRILRSADLFLRRTYYLGPYVWDLVIRPDGRFAYGIDSFRGQLVIVDLEASRELRSCAVEVGYGGRILLQDPRTGRIFIGVASPGAVEVVQ